MRGSAAGRRRQRGVALLLVLWVFMVLGVLALDFSRYMRDDAMAAVNFAEETHGYYLALAGLNRTIFELELAREDVGGGTTDADADDEDVDDVSSGPEADGEWHEGMLGAGRYAVRVTDEGGRVSLRKPNEPLLRHVVTNLLRGGPAAQGMDRRTETAVNVVVDSMLDWIDADDQARMHGAESAYYLARRPPYAAKNWWFSSIDELLFVRGVTADVFYGNQEWPGLRQVLSVYSRSARVNLRTTTAPVLQALLGVDRAAAEELVAQREEDYTGFEAAVQAQFGNAAPTIAVDETFASGAATTVAVEVQADLARERNRSRVAAVVALGGSADETRIVRWLDRAPWDGSFPTAAVAAEREGA